MTEMSEKAREKAQKVIPDCGFGHEHMCRDMKGTSKPKE